MENKKKNNGIAKSKDNDDANVEVDELGDSAVTHHDKRSKINNYDSKKNKTSKNTKISNNVNKKHNVKRKQGKTKNRIKE